MTSTYYKSFAKLILLLLPLLLFTSTTKAVDIAAADIYYEYLSPLNYRVHLKVYKECSDTSAINTTDSISVSSVSNAYTAKFLIDTANVNDPINGSYRHYWGGSILTNCVDPQSTYPGYQYFHYAGNVTLPQAANDWEFIWSQCCRGNNQNIVDTTICLRAGLNNLIRANYSTILTAIPITKLKINQAFNYLNSPIDPDLDSVVITTSTPGTQITNPFNTYNCTAAQFIAPYTQSNPIPSSTPYQIDPTTGNATFTINQFGRYFVKFRATDYDPISGLEVGFVEREALLDLRDTAWATSVNQVENVRACIKIFPNPSKGLFTIEAAKKWGRIENVSVYNTQGRKMQAAYKHEQLDVSNLASGVYFVQITNTRAKVFIERLVIQ